MKRFLPLICAVIGLVGLEGCATVKSTRHAGATSAEGISYFLPTRRTRLTATRTLADGETAARAVEARRTALTAARLAFETAKTEHDNLKAQLERATVDTVRTALQTQVTAALLKMQIAENNQARTLEAFNAAREIATEVEATGAICIFAAKVELLPSEPDPAYRFVAMPSHNILRDDTTTLTLTASGLLSNANAVAVDRTGDIIVEMAGAIAGSGASGGAIVKSAGQKNGASPASCRAITPRLVMVFDPGADLTAVNTALASANYPLRLSASPGHDASAPVGAARAADADAALLRFDNDTDGALYYRSPLPVLLSIEQQVCSAAAPRGGVTERCADGVLFADWHSIDASIVLLPQRGPISYVPMNSSAFVRTVDDVVFTDGIVTSWTSERPSEALEIVRLPVKVMQALISVPAQLLQLRVNYSSDSEALATNQQAEIAAQQRLRALEACLAAGGEDVVATCLPDD